MAQTYLGEAGVLCGATCWIKFAKATAPVPVKVEVLGAAVTAFGADAVASRAEAAFVIDSRADVGQASALLKELVTAKSTAGLVCLIPADEARQDGTLEVKDRQLALRGWCRCARNETNVAVKAIQMPFPITPAAAAALLALLARNPPDQEFAWTGDQWEVPRILPVTVVPDQVQAAPDARLQVGRPGQLSSLHWHPLYAEGPIACVHDATGLPCLSS